MAGTKVPAAETIEKERRALGLRRAGITYDEIARQVGYANASGARKAVMRGLKRTLQDDADATRQLEADRLDRLQAGVWNAAAGGDVQALDRVLKIMDRRAKLLGLDVPAKHELTGPGGGGIIVEVLPELLPSMNDSDAQADAPDDDSADG
jgi:hypothetical protein